VDARKRTALPAWRRRVSSTLSLTVIHVHDQQERVLPPTAGLVTGTADSVSYKGMH
jgi:hypothetical protein